jgi:lysophospholipase L1-like esterase
MKYFVSVLLVLLISTISFAQKKQSVVFPADAPEIMYAGRIDFTNPVRPSFCHPGVSVKTIFTGTELHMLLEDFATGDEKTTNYFTVIVDDKVVQTLQTITGKQSYLLASGLPNQKHSIELFKRTECLVGSCTFLGFKAPHGTTLEKPVEKKYRIEFIGDSFTCGYGNEVSIAAPPEGNPGTGFHSKNENHYLSYSALVSRLLNTEYRCIAYSGRGMYRNNTGSEEGTLPKIYARIFPDDIFSASWDFKKELPDVVVIKLGANDFYPEANGNELDDAAFTQTYITFVERIRSHYPKAKIVCVTGVSMSDSWPAGRNCLTRIQQDVQKVVENRKNAGDNEVYYFKLDQQVPPYGEDWHASIVTHQRMAEQFAPFIKQITGW